MTDTHYSTKQVAELADIHRDTLLRWLREGRIPEPQQRNRNGWRIFTAEEAEAISKYASTTQSTNVIAENQATYLVTLPFHRVPERLLSLDWNFTGVNTSYLTHSIHPYPCKFIPQIPNALIQELSFIGDTVLDPFCGSGTTLVEALRLGRNAIGLDANPLACLISRTKSAYVKEVDIQHLKALANEIANLTPYTQHGLQPTLFNPVSVPSLNLPTSKGIIEWFDPNVIEELAVIKQKCMGLSSPLQKLALTVFSSIIVSVSRQDSETRYVRREKNIPSGEVYRRFVQALNNLIERLQMLALEIDAKLKVEVFNANILKPPSIDSVDLVVCSPPYPNAFSYHLYHRTRMEWLGMDQPTFKRDEIGSHRKYSSKGKGAASVETFQHEMKTIFEWLAKILRLNRHACFVIGDSTINGKKIHNDELLIAAAESSGFRLEVNIPRQLQASKKSFNPSIGKIHDEHIVILRNMSE